jgi:hypothetical protein
VGDGAQLLDIRYDHFVTELSQLLTDPDGMRARFHGDPRRWNPIEMLA